MAYYPAGIIPSLRSIGKYRGRYRLVLQCPRLSEQDTLTVLIFIEPAVFADKAFLTILAGAVSDAMSTRR